MSFPLSRRERGSKGCGPVALAPQDGLSQRHRPHLVLRPRHAHSGTGYATGITMTTDSPFSGSTAGDSSGAGGARFPRQALPTDQSVLWRPAVQELARPDDDPSLIFIAQRALAAVEDHLVSAPHEALLGFLVGRVFETPETGMPYVIVHGAVRVPQMIVDGASERV